jgi:hypothetical protein
VVELGGVATAAATVKRGAGWMSPEEYVNEIVIPTVAEFKNDLRSRRRAYLACIATHHIKDHLREAGERGVEAKMRQACGDFYEVVRAICNGTKHVIADKSHPISHSKPEMIVIGRLHSPA